MTWGCRAQVHMHEGADPNHTQGRETSRGPEVQLLLKYWAGSSGCHLPVALHPLYWVTFPSTLYSHLIKSQVWRISVQVMIWFGSMECQEAAKTTDTAARGDGGSWEMCAHWIMDAHRREHLLFIWSSHPFSISPIKPTTFTNVVTLRTSCAQKR